jgi:alkanesulfonate monooxygenase SsuD/methylene tetrahydromethanopterin reductase-like flavin-dependent oxidoreductase (luciferase family)
MHAIHVAKQAATIDVLSGGRFVLGVGVGGREEDYRAMGASFARRHPTLDEQVAIMRRVWRGDAPVEGVSAVGPAPVQVGGPPVLAAAMGPKSMARAARWADGVAGFDIPADADGIGKGFRRFEAAWAEAGREVARCSRRRSGSGSTPMRPTGCDTPSATCASSVTTPRAWPGWRRRRRRQRSGPADRDRGHGVR